jgi:hypothetical protein
MKKGFYYLNQLEPKTRTEVVENIITQQDLDVYDYLLKRKHENISTFLLRSFDWESTRQGLEYWQSKYRDLCGSNCETI